MAAVVCALAAASASGLAQRRGGEAPQGERRREPESAAARRIQTRTYLFEPTHENIEYAVFVSTKVKKEKKSPLVVALHGAGVSPRQMLGFVADAAQDGGYIVVAPMGYALDGWYGIRGRLPPGSPPNLADLSEQDVMNVLALARKEFDIDDRRIYLLGQSMGGAGALFLGVKYHQIRDGAGAGGVDLVFLARHGKAHMQKIRRVFQVVSRIDEGLASRIFVRHGGDGRHFRDHADARHLTLRRILNIDRVVIKR